MEDVSNVTLALYAAIIAAFSGILAWFAKDGIPKLFQSKIRRAEDYQEHIQSLELMNARTAQNQLTLALNKAIGTDERIINEASLANDFVRTQVMSSVNSINEELRSLKKKHQDDSERILMHVSQLKAAQSDWMHEFQMWQLERDKDFSSKMAEIEKSVSWTSELLPILHSLVGKDERR